MSNRAEIKAATAVVQEPTGSVWPKIRAAAADPLIASVTGAGPSHEEGSARHAIDTLKTAPVGDEAKAWAVRHFGRYAGLVTQWLRGQGLDGRALLERQYALAVLAQAVLAELTLPKAKAIEHMAAAGATPGKEVTDPPVMGR